MKLLKLGEYHRHYAETRMNHQSSRSHTLFRLHVESVATTIPESDGASGTNIIRESVLVSLKMNLSIYRILLILLEVKRYRTTFQEEELTFKVFMDLKQVVLLVPRAL